MQVRVDGTGYHSAGAPTSSSATALRPFQSLPTTLTHLANVDIHQFRFELLVEDCLFETIRPQVQGVWQNLSAPGCEGEPVEVRVWSREADWPDFKGMPELQLMGNARVTQHASASAYHTDVGMLFVAKSDFVASVMPGLNRIDLVLLSHEGADGQLRRVPSAGTFLHWAMLEWLSLHGLFCLHAACVSLDGRGILLTGDSGAGKTTTAISLVKEGLAFLGDDLVLLDTRSDPPLIRSMRRHLKVDRKTIALHPELARIAKPMPYAVAGTAVPDVESTFAIAQLPGATTHDLTTARAVVLVEPFSPRGADLVRYDAARGVAALLKSSAHQVDPKRERVRFDAACSVMRSAVCFGAPRPDHGLRDARAIIRSLED
jgi:HPr Serine kinase C-terminal domain